MIDSGRVDDAVGPVLQATPLGWAVVAAIEADNDGVEVRDEAQFGQPVQFPGDLEVIMSSFCGLVAMSEAGAVWWQSSEPRPEVPS